MSDEMPSWKSLASSASRSIKSYVSQRDLKRPFPASREDSVDGTPKRQTWGQWAGQKLRQAQGETVCVEQLLLFPGWATRRYRAPTPHNTGDAVYDIELFVSGFASRSSGSGFGTRSGRAFLKLAKSFAALPKLTIQSAASAANSDWLSDAQLSTDDLKSMRLPPLPDEMDENAELEALESQLRELDVNPESSTSTLSAETASVASSCSAASTTSSYSDARTNNQAKNTLADLQKWHSNLEARLHPFWCSALSARTIRVSVFASDPSSHGSDDDATEMDDRSRRPIFQCNMVTAADGSFQTKLHVHWEILRVHSKGTKIAHDALFPECQLFVVAELFPPPAPPRTPSGQGYQQSTRLVLKPTAVSSIPIPLTQAAIRIISDVDDTVKLSSVLSGARAVFRNVFVKDLDDGIIPGMAEWYSDMWKRGVRFHYVSNAPFEILPVLNEFFRLCQLPPGSLKLRSYGGRSLFSGLLSAPATRKRGGVVEILDNFPDSQFILIGDSGEQDLELYAGIAKERPAQVLAVFVRDVSGDSGAQPLDDPTGSKVLRLDRVIPPSISRRSSTRSNIARGPVARSMSDNNAPAKYAVRQLKRMRSDTALASGLSKASDSYFPSTSLTDSPVTEDPEEMSTHSSPGIISEQDSYDAYSGSRQYMSEAERRRSDLQMRVWRARLEVPEHIPLRVFRQPNECMESTIILDGLIPRD